MSVSFMPRFLWNIACVTPSTLACLRFSRDA